MLSEAQIQEIVGRCKFPNWQILVKRDGNRLYLQVSDPNGIDIATGGPMPWTGRKWMLSPHMVPNEIVTTAFKAVLTAMEHEVREMFTYRDQPIFNPHIDPDKMAEFVANRSNLQEREDVQYAA